MRKWLAGWLSTLGCPRLADRVWPHYSEWMRRQRNDGDPGIDIDLIIF